MTLTHLFRLHAILAALYALGLLLVPQITISLLSPMPLNPLATDITRLLGAALVLITLVAWGGQSSERPPGPPGYRRKFTRIHKPGCGDYNRRPTGRQLGPARLEHYWGLSHLEGGLWILPVRQTRMSNLCATAEGAPQSTPRRGTF
jgi:hypothetical protein